MRDFSPVTLRDILHVFFKYKYRTLLIFVIAVSGAFGYLLYVDPLYKAETKILVLIGKEKYSAIDTYTKSANVMFAERGQNTHNEIEILTDPGLTLAVMPHLSEWLDAAYLPPTTFLQKLKKWMRTTYRSIKEVLYTPLYYVGLATRLTPEQKFAAALYGGLGVEFIEETDIIRLSFAWPSPQFAAVAANAYAEKYIQRRIKVHESSNSQKFYIDQIKISRDKLTAAETDLDTFLEVSKISSLSTQKNLLLNEISRLEAEYNHAMIELADARLKSGIVRDTHESTRDWIETPDLGETAPDFGSLDDHYFGMLSKRIELLDSFTEDSRNITSLNFQMEELRSQKAASLINFLDTRMRALKSKTALFDKELTAKRAQIATLRGHTLRLAELERNKAILEETYLKYKVKAEDMRISDDLNVRAITSVRIISQAITPVKPYSPKKWIILGIASFLGVFLGFGYATVSEFFNHTFRDHDDVEDVLGVPLLISIPDMDQKTPATYIAPAQG